MNINEPITPKKLLESYRQQSDIELSAADIVTLIESNLILWAQYYTAKGRIIEDICPILQSMVNATEAKQYIPERQINRIAATEWHNYNSHYSSIDDERNRRLFKQTNFKAALGQAEREWCEEGQLFHFGIDELDKAMGGGVTEGEMMSIIGNPGSMKTSLLLSGIQRWVAEQGGKVAFFSLDMGKTAIIERLYARLLCCSPAKVRELAAQRTPEYKKAFQELKDLYTGHLEILENKTGVRWNIDSVKEYIERNQPKLVCIDYLTLLKTETQSDFEIANTATAKLLDCAQMYGFALVLLSQMSVESQRLQSKGGTGGSAKGGGYVNERADIEIELFKDTGVDEFGNDNGAEIVATIKKTRKNGACASYRLDFEGEWMRFKSTAEKVGRVKQKEKIFGHANTAWFGMCGRG